jgi:hypothetical protein
MASLDDGFRVFRRNPQPIHAADEKESLSCVFQQAISPEQVRAGFAQFDQGRRHPHPVPGLTRRTGAMVVDVLPFVVS